MRRPLEPILVLALALSACKGDGDDQDVPDASGSAGDPATDEGASPAADTGTFDVGGTDAAHDLTPTPQLDTGQADSELQADASSDGGRVEDVTLPGEDAGGPPDDAGESTADIGLPNEDAGGPVDDAGRPLADTGDPPGDAGGPSDDVGSPATDTGIADDGGSGDAGSTDGGGQADAAPTSCDDDADGDGRGPGCPAGPDCDDGDPDNWVGCDACVDDDEDSHFSGCDRYVVRLGEDCDDGNPALLRTVTHHVDQDGDHFGTGGVLSTACVGRHPDIPFALAEQAGDCDDAEPRVNPASLEVPADGIDQDCDGEDLALSDAIAVFVDGENGDDDNEGTMASPLWSLGAAIALAEDTDRAVVAAEGFYEVIATDVTASLFGGFRNTNGVWTRDVESFTSVLSSAQEVTLAYTPEIIIDGWTAVGEFAPGPFSFISADFPDCRSLVVSNIQFYVTHAAPTIVEIDVADEAYACHVLIADNSNAVLTLNGAISVRAFADAVVLVGNEVPAEVAGFYVRARRGSVLENAVIGGGGNAIAISDPVSAGAAIPTHLRIASNRIETEGFWGMQGQIWRGWYLVTDNHVTMSGDDSAGIDLRQTVDGNGATDEIEPFIETRILRNRVDITSASATGVAATRIWRGDSGPPPTHLGEVTVANNVIRIIETDSDDFVDDVRALEVEWPATRVLNNTIVIQGTGTAMRSALASDTSLFAHNLAVQLASVPWDCMRFTYYSDAGGPVQMPVSVIGNDCWAPGGELSLLNVRGESAREWDFAVTDVDELNECGWPSCLEAGLNISEDPRFSGAGPLGLGLAADSPCIDLGAEDPVSMPGGVRVAEDIEGDARPLDGDGSGSGEWDCGADEYAP